MFSGLSAKLNINPNDLRRMTSSSSSSKRSSQKEGSAQSSIDLEPMSRSQLTNVIKEQSKKLGKYESKLRDLIGAYKSLQTEKTALSASLAALGNKKQVGIEPTAVKPALNRRKSLSDLKIPLKPPEQTFRKGKSLLDLRENTPDKPVWAGNVPCKCHLQINALKEQVATLSKSLQTLTDEKTKSQSNFLQERRRLTVESEARIGSLTKKLQDLQKEHVAMEMACGEFKKLICSERNNRQAEDGNYNCVIKELQGLLNSERQAVDKLNLEVTALGLIRKERDRLRVDLREADLVRKNLEKEVQESRKSLGQLQKELSELREVSALNCREDLNKVGEVEGRLREVLRGKEERVMKLEMQLGEVTASVCRVDEVQRQDLKIIESLQSKISNLQERLEDERGREIRQVFIEKPLNISLYKSWLSSSLSTPQVSDFLKNLPDSHHSLVAKVLSTLSLALRDTPFPQTSIFEREEAETDAVKLVHRSFKALLLAFLGSEETVSIDYSNIKNTILETSSTPFNTQNQEIKTENSLDKLKNRRKEGREILELEKKVEFYKNSLQKYKNDLAKAESLKNEEIKRGEVEKNKLNLKFQQERQRIIEEYEEKLSKIKGQFDAHRIRTGNLLTEMEAEPHLKKIPDQRFSSEEFNANNLNTNITNIDIHDFSHDLSSGQSLHDKVENSIAQYNATALRRELKEVKENFRVEGREFEAKEERLMEMIGVLKGEIRRLEQLGTCEGANVVYIKDLLIKYLTRKEKGIQRQTLKTLSMLLNFQGSELALINAFL